MPPGGPRLIGRGHCVARLSVAGTPRPITLTQPTSPGGMPIDAVVAISTHSNRYLPRTRDGEAAAAKEALVK